MPSGNSLRLQQLMEIYVSGRDRSAPHVREIEGEFVAEGLDDDDRFSDLQYALAMFGADGRDDIEQLLVRECGWAMKTLRGVCVYRDCRNTIVEGTRFCSLHQPE